MFIILQDRDVRRLWSSKKMRQAGSSSRECVESTPDQMEIPETRSSNSSLGIDENRRFKCSIDVLHLHQILPLLNSTTLPILFTKIQCFLNRMTLEGTF